MAGPKHTGCTPKLEKFPQLGLKLIELIASGCTQAHAAELCQIPPQTISDWIARGKEPGARKCWRDFSSGIEKARVDFVQSNLDGIKRHARQSWQAHAWLLERLGGRQFASPDAQMRHRLEEVEKVLTDLRALAIAKGLVEEATTNALQPPQD